jgi:hypothetical protein
MAIDCIVRPVDRFLDLIQGVIRLSALGQQSNEIFAGDSEH